jgi:hypothetical protein
MVDILTILAIADGIEYLCANGMAWLVDAIASYQGTKALKTEDLQYFQLWQLKVDDGKAVLTCRADSDMEPAVKQMIEYTDCTLSEITIYVELGSIDCVNEEFICMLPSER